jgi:hypothetical protein
MVTDSFLSLACAGVIGTLFGLALAFFGYRMFLVLLPIFGFFFGLAFGAQTIQALFGDAFLATVTSWVVGFLAGALFAVLSYLFYFFAVALIAGALGYSAVVGIWSLLGLDFGLIAWLIGIVAAVALAFVTLRFNLQKWVIILGTAVLGAAAVVETMLLLFVPAARVMESPVRVALDQSVLLLILFAALAVAGFYVQYRTNRAYTVATYNNWSTTS